MYDQDCLDERSKSILNVCCHCVFTREFLSTVSANTELCLQRAAASSTCSFPEEQRSGILLVLILRGTPWYLRYIALHCMLTLDNFGCQCRMVVCDDGGHYEVLCQPDACYHIWLVHADTERQQHSNMSIPRCLLRGDRLQYEYREREREWEGAMLWTNQAVHPLGSSSDHAQSRSAYRPKTIVQSCVIVSP